MGTKLWKALRLKMRYKVFLDKRQNSLENNDTINTVWQKLFNYCYKTLNYGSSWNLSQKEYKKNVCTFMQKKIAFAVILVSNRLFLLTFYGWKCHCFMPFTTNLNNIFIFFRCCSWYSWKSNTEPNISRTIAFRSFLLSSRQL